MTSHDISFSGSAWFRRSMVVLALLGSLALQVHVARIPDTMGDAMVFGVWCDRVVQVGIDQAYFESGYIGINYPPVYPILLKALGTVRPLIPVTMTDGTPDNLHFFVKLPAVLAGILTSLLIFFTVRRGTGHRTAFLVMLCYAFNPSVTFNSAYWGQLEAVYSLFVLLALACLFSHNALAWVFATIAVLTKAQAAPFAPIVLLVTLREFGWRAVLRGAGASLATLIVIIVPFIAAGHTSAILLRMLGDLGTSPFASQNGHNLWWIVTSGKWIASTGYRIAGTLLFCAAYALLMIRIWQGRHGDPIYLACAVVAATFFLLMPGMHENHLFPVLPLLAIISYRNRSVAVLYALFTVTFLANMVLHDPFLEAEYIYGRTFDPEKIWIFDPSGPKSTAHWTLGFSNSVANVLLVGSLVYVWMRSTRGELRPQPQG